jgi:aspartyl protease family protein
VSSDDTAQLAAAVLMLVLVGSSLLSRRLPLGDAARMIAGWVLIFAVVLVGYSYRGELGLVAQRITGDLLGERGQTVGETLRVPMAEDGHFWVRGGVNGTQVRFLVDSGATTTALSARTAAAAGLDIDESGLPVVIGTANGQVRARRAQIETLSLGPIVTRDMAVVVSPAFGEVNVLGMNFLSSLGSWRVDGRTLVLEPHTGGSAS